MNLRLCITFRSTVALTLGLIGLEFASPLAQGAAPSVDPILYTCEVVVTWPHDREAFTEGLCWADGQLFESTGNYGQSSFRKVDLKTGRPVQELKLAPDYFGEGMTLLNHKAYQLTWKNKVGFIYNLDTWKSEGEFSFEGEGWGLTTDGKWLIMSNGTDELRFIDPENFRVVKTIHVVSHGAPVKNLNELEYIKGEIFANVWQTNWLVRIDPASGALLGTVNLSHLLAPEDYTQSVDVLNGIAYDAAADRLFVTGKNWPKLFEIRLHPTTPAP